MLRSPWTLWLAILLFPPLGLILLWMRDSRTIAKFAGTVAILAIAAIELFFVYGFRVVFNGNMDHVIDYSFRWSSKHDAMLEQSRAQQQQQPEPEPVIQPAAAPA